MPVVLSWRPSFFPLLILSNIIPYSPPFPVSVPSLTWTVIISSSNWLYSYFFSTNVSPEPSRGWHQVVEFCNIRTVSLITIQWQKNNFIVIVWENKNMFVPIWYDSHVKIIHLPTINFFFGIKRKHFLEFFSFNNIFIRTSAGKYSTCIWKIPSYEDVASMFSKTSTSRAHTHQHCILDYLFLWILMASYCK